jgi:ABC-type nickel/cobalt efflux system permease component RcnA
MHTRAETKRMTLRKVITFLVAICPLSFSRIASAHPMGNFSVNHYAKIDLGSDHITIRYIIDLAEIPAYQEMQQGEIHADAADAAVLRYVAARGNQLSRGLRLAVNGEDLPLRLISSGVLFPPGAGGLPTMKMGFTYEAIYPAGIDRARLQLRYADNNFPGQTGWKEIVAVASAGSLLSSSAPATDRSEQLSNYPTDLLSSPPQALEATVTAALPAIVDSTHGAAKFSSHRSKATRIPSASPITSAAVVSRKSAQAASALATTVNLQANRKQTPRSKFTELIAAPHLSLWFLFTAAFIAVGLGGLHALEPGHGKTIVAAYLVGSRGTAAHAILLGLIVTVSHTAGVFALGAITLYASRSIVPEKLYPWLGLFSGLTIAALGCYMALRRLTGTASSHSHLPGESHSHWPLFRRASSENQPKYSEAPAPSAKSVSLTQLLTLGITGGIIPCPAALIVLLSAVALHRIGFGFFLIVAFSIGLAAVLIGFGVLMVYARRFMSRMAIDGPFTRRWLPLASSVFITVLGLGLAFQALSSMSHQILFISRARIGALLLVTGLGLILGIRHSTDPDHVVAISTIVARQKSVRGATIIGSVWGIGHTITIFVVGALIILFNVQIPPRLGLSMEFCVALMLVLLGALNLSGVLAKVTRFFTPVKAPAASRQPDLPRNWASPAATALSQISIYHYIRPLVVGLVHGLAGSAAVALLVLSTIHDPAWATLYLLIFGGGTMLGMMGMTTAMAAPIAFAGKRSATFSRHLATISGMISLGFGSFLAFQLGIIGGLFTSHPIWTPR